MGRIKFIGPLSSSCHIFLRRVYLYTVSTVVEILRVNGFQFQMAAVRHPGFLKVGNFNCRSVWSANMRHQAKFSADRSNVAETRPFFNFFKMAASAILDFKS